MSTQRRNLPIALAALLLIVLGVTGSTWLRIHVANSDPLWLDELHSVWVIQHDATSIQVAAAKGNQAPLYFWILNAVSFQNPQDPISIRWLSILCAGLSTASVGFFIYFWTRSLSGSALGVLLTAIDPNFVFYGSEARPYSMLALVALWQFFTFSLCLFPRHRNKEHQLSEKLLRRPPLTTHIVSFAILSVILVLTHHTGILLLASEVVIATSLFLIGRTTRNSWLILIGILGAIGIGIFAMQAGSIFNTFQRRNQWSTISSTAELLRAYAPAILFLGVVPFAVMLITLRFRAIEDNRQTELTFCALAWAVGPALIAGCCDWLQLAPLALYRYTLVGAIAFPIFAGLSISWIRSNLLQAIVAVVILALSIFGPLPQFGNEQSVDFKFANEFLAQESPKLFTDAPIRMRYESWDSATNLLKTTDAPVFLFANLLEDEILEADRQAHKEPNPRLVDYLKFPLTHCQDIDPNRIIPRPSHSGAAFLNRDLARVANFQEFCVVIRGDTNMVQRILNELHSSLLVERYSATYDQFQFENHNGVPEWLTVVKVTLR